MKLNRKLKPENKMKLKCIYKGHDWNYWLHYYIDTSYDALLKSIEIYRICKRCNKTYGSGFIDSKFLWLSENTKIYDPEEKR